MAYSTRRFILLNLALCFVIVFFSHFSIAITSLDIGRAGPCAFHASVCFARVVFLSSSSWCQGLDAASDCGTPWTFLFYLF